MLFKRANTAELDLKFVSKKSVAGRERYKEAENG
jgi:hypothetical protein